MGGPYTKFRVFSSPATRPSSLNRPLHDLLGCFPMRILPREGPPPGKPPRLAPAWPGPSVLRRLERYEGRRGSAMPLKCGGNTENRIQKSTTSASFRFAKLPPEPPRGSHSQHGSLGKKECSGAIQLPPRVAGRPLCMRIEVHRSVLPTQFGTFCRISEVSQLCGKEVGLGPLVRRVGDPPPARAPVP